MKIIGTSYAVAFAPHSRHAPALEQHPRYATGFEPQPRRPAALEPHPVEEHGPFRAPTDAAATRKRAQRSESSPEVMLGLCLLTTMLAGAAGLVAILVL